MSGFYIGSITLEPETEDGNNSYWEVMLRPRKTSSLPPSGSEEMMTHLYDLQAVWQRELDDQASPTMTLGEDVIGASLSQTDAGLSAARSDDMSIKSNLWDQQGSYSFTMVWRPEGSSERTVVSVYVLKGDLERREMSVRGQDGHSHSATSEAGNRLPAVTEEP